MGRKNLEDLIQDHVTHMEREKKAPGYIVGVLKGVKSWLAHNEIELKRPIKVRDADATPRIADERVPTKEELKTVLVYAGERAKASICLIAQAGLRPESLGNESGTDGIKIGDMPELVIKENKAIFQRIPTMVVVRSEISKGRNRYFTFLPREGCEYITAYLNKRLAQNETITSSTPVIAVKPGYELQGKGKRNRGSSFITTRNVSREIREAIRPAFKWRPYVLRAYFDTQMLMAESHGRITHPYRVFFMGHKGDIEARYTTNKGRLPENLIEDMRRTYQESTEYLETTPTQQKDRKELLLEMWRDQAKFYGIDPMRIKIERQKDLGRPLTLDEEERILQNEIRKLAAGRVVSRETMRNGGTPLAEFENKLIEEQELVLYLNDGWEIVEQMKSGKITIRKQQTEEPITPIMT
ncbi:MAG: site-specific integrase [Candidatus Bathyarchaeia archaeon]|jgi:hypothetical protein